MNDAECRVEVRDPTFSVVHFHLSLSQPWCKVGISTDFFAQDRTMDKKNAEALVLAAGREDLPTVKTLHAQGTPLDVVGTLGEQPTHTDDDVVMARQEVTVLAADMNQLIAAVSAIQIEHGQITANEVAALLQKEDSLWADVSITDIRKACSKATKRAHAQQSARNHNDAPPKEPTTIECSTQYWRLVFVDGINPASLRGCIVDANAQCPLLPGGGPLCDLQVLSRRCKVAPLLADFIMCVLSAMETPYGLLLDEAWRTCSACTREAYEAEIHRNNVEVLPVLRKVDGVRKVVGIRTRLLRAIKKGEQLLASFGWFYWEERIRLDKEGLLPMVRYGPHQREVTDRYDKSRCWVCFAGTGTIESNRVALEEGNELRRCPLCVEEKVAVPARFCSTECQKKAWRVHKKWHKSGSVDSWRTAPFLCLEEGSMILNDQVMIEEGSKGADDGAYRMYIRRAQMSIDERQYRQAANLLESAVRVNPLQYEAHLLLGRVYQLSAAPAHAVLSYLDSILALEPSSAYERLGKPGLHRWAIAICNAFHLVFPDVDDVQRFIPVACDFDVPLLRGRTAWVADPDELKMVAEMVCMARPDCPESWTMMGNVVQRHHIATFGSSFTQVFGDGVSCDAAALYQRAAKLVPASEPERRAHYEDIAAKKALATSTMESS